MTGAGLEINKDAGVGIKKKTGLGLRPERDFQRFLGRARECKEVHIIDRNVASMEHITGISRVSTGYLSFEWRSHKATLRSHSVASPRPQSRSYLKSGLEEPARGCHWLPTSFRTVSSFETYYTRKISVRQLMAAPVNSIHV